MQEIDGESQNNLESWQEKIKGTSQLNQESLQKEIEDEQPQGILERFQDEMGGISRSILQSPQDEIGEESEKTHEQNHQEEMKEEFSIEKVDKTVSSELEQLYNEDLLDVNIDLKKSNNTGDSLQHKTPQRPPNPH